MPIPHFVHAHRHQTEAEKRRSRLVAAILAPNLIAIVLVLWYVSSHWHRKPPNIFDSPVDDVAGFLVSKDFNALSTQERLEYIQGIFKRFESMNQSDSAVAAAFFAGLGSSASEQLVNNARTLGKDILVEGAQQFFALTTEKEREAFLDQWVVKWVRFAGEMGGRDAAGNDQDILNRLTHQAQRDAGRMGGEIDLKTAEQLVEFWQRDVSSVTSPREQGMIFQFVPALRDHMLRRGQ